MINKITFTGREPIVTALKMVSKKAYDYVGADKVYPAAKQQAKAVDEFIHAGKVFEDVDLSKKVQNQQTTKQIDTYTSPYMLTRLQDIREIEARENYAKSYPISHGTPEKEISGLVHSNNYFA